MSGFEIVGVVLGSLPLVISALEHYTEGISTIANMAQYQTVFTNIHCQFVVALAIYKQSCTELLKPLMLPDNQFHSLLEQRKGWEDATLVQILRDRLEEDYKPYQQLVKILDKKIALFGRKLKLEDDDMRPPWVLKDGKIDTKLRAKFFKNVWTRVRGGFSTDKYAKLLAEISHDIDQIATLTKGAISLEEFRHERKRSLDNSYWINIRDHTLRLFDIFSIRWPQKCSCQHPHRANLRLDLRKQRSLENPSPRFGFLLSFDVNEAVKSSLPWDWRDVEIEPWQIPNAPTMLVTPTQPSIKKTARFAPSPAIMLSPFSSITHETSSPQLSQSAMKIDDLCDALQRKAQSKCCIGYLDDQHWQHHVYSTGRPNLKDQLTSSASLQDILYGSNMVNLSIREKCTIALTLALAVLQLHNTPWLSESWDTKDIYFIKGNLGMPNISQPYVSKSFTHTSDSPQPMTGKFRPHIIKNEMVFALGKALLELSYGKPILSFKTEEDLDDQGNATMWTEFSIANRLVDASSKQISEINQRTNVVTIDKRELPNFAKAVTRCITFRFDTFTCSLDDDSFREGFYQDVVVPLQEDYDLFEPPTKS